jgi:hypothetical protein
MRRASLFFKIPQNERSLLEVLIQFSYELESGQLVARFRSQEVLLLMTGLNKNRLSEALNYLESCGICKREGTGKGPIVLTLLPDWYNWAAPAISPRYTDKLFVATLVGYSVTKRDDTWVAEPAPRVHPMLQDAIVYARGEVAGADASAAVAEAQSQHPKPMGRRARPAKPEREQPAVGEPTGDTIGLDELQADAARLFPNWVEDERRDGWIAKVAANRGPCVLHRALQRAALFGPSKIRFPRGWLKKVMDEISPPE